MASTLEILREILTLTNTVGRLESVVDELKEKSEEHEKRITILENREELLQEKMANSAIKAVNEMNYKYFERLSEIENTIKSITKSDPKQ